MLECRKVNYTYGAGTPAEVHVLKDVDLVLDKGEFVGIIGHTGSGKSTLIQHLNGLLKPSDGEVLYNGQNIWADKYDRRALRGHVGLVFQYPEHQLFEAEVFTDVCFGPKNQGLSQEEIERRAREAMNLVGLGPEFDARSPFELSGGQKRRVAIAGVLAMKPDYLILDEPTAGLDPGGRDEILGVLKHLHEEQGITVILVSHSMEDVANYVDRIVVINNGEIAFDDVPHRVFLHYKELEAFGLSAPQVTYIAQELRAAGLMVDETVTTVNEAKASILKALAQREKGGR